MIFNKKSYLKRAHTIRFCELKGQNASMALGAQDWLSPW